MKRVFPDSNHQPVRRPAPVMAEEHSLNSLPVEIVEHICTFLGPQDTCSTFLTLTRFYYPVRENEAFWQRFFERYYYSPSPKQPGQSWLGACKEQNRMLFNIIAGRCTTETIPLDDAPSRFTRDDQGRFILAYLDGSVKVFDPKTKDSVTLEGPHELYVEKIVYGAGLCAVQWRGKICAWELATPPKKIFNWEYKEHINTKIELIGERLLIQSTHPHWSSPQVKSSFIIHVINLKLDHKRAFPSKPLTRPIKTTVFGDKVFVVSTSAPANFQGVSHFKCRLSVLDLNTNRCISTVPMELPQCFSDSLEMCYSPGHGLFGFSPRASLIHKFDFNKACNNKEFRLWQEPGIPDGFCYREEDSTLTLPFPMKELSFLFHKCLFEQFYLWSNVILCNSIKNFLPQVLLDSGANRGMFHQGKLFSFSSNNKAIHCLDFTASREDVLKEIVKRLEAEDEPPVDDGDTANSDESLEDEEDRTPLGYALRFLDRMPKPVRDAIWSIHDDNLPEGWEEGAVDPEYIKDSILAYLESTKGE
jgi:hypothetical protein